MDFTVRQKLHKGSDVYMETTPTSLMWSKNDLVIVSMATWIVGSQLTSSSRKTKASGK
jgi:hypothetical protein